MCLFSCHITLNTGHKTVSVAHTLPPLTPFLPVMKDAETEFEAATVNFRWFCRQFGDASRQTRHAPHHLTTGHLLQLLLGSYADVLSVFFLHHGKYSSPRTDHTSLLIDHTSLHFFPYFACIILCCLGVLVLSFPLSLFSC